ncbi:YeeE/YedE family protein, partial [Thozetella sp. PMI_491]
MATTVLSGAVFGAALTAAGVYHPSVILSQLQFTDWHMLQSFLTATATSGVLVLLARRLGYISPGPRNFSSVGVFGPFDGNVLGGALLGIGMALSGACPGTIFSQVALGVKSGWWALYGSIIGGIVYTGYVRPYLAERSLRLAPEKAVKPRLTIHESLGLSRLTGFILLESLFLGVINFSLLTSPAPRARIHPVFGGLLIGAGQLVSIVLRKSLVGTSGSFEEAGSWLWRLVRGGGSRTSVTSIVFCAGVAAGSWVVVKTIPELAGRASPEIAPLSAFAGGVVMIVGSRVAGGCTSGHGISGMSLQSISSVITIVSAFTSGAGVAAILY